MSYRVEFSNKALKELKKLDKSISLMITSWLRKNLEGCEDPRRYGKELIANHAEKWRYRVGDYRLLAEIQDGRLIILLIKIGHRRDV